MEHIKTKEQARQYAIDAQLEICQESLSYEEILAISEKLTVLADKFDLREEFIENGLI